MAVAENGKASNDIQRSNENGGVVAKDQNLSYKSHNKVASGGGGGVEDDGTMTANGGVEKKNESDSVNGVTENGVTHDGYDNGVVNGYGDGDVKKTRSDVDFNDGDDIKKGNNDGVGGEGMIKKEIRDLEDMLSKLNPMAKEFVPPSLTNFRGVNNVNGFGFVNNYVIQPNVAAAVAAAAAGVANGNGYTGRRRRNGFGNGKRRMNTRTSMAQRDEVIRRTVYVSDIDQQVTEEQLASLFINCGQVVDCRVCGDPNSILRFAFIEFTDEEGAKNALTLSGTMLGFYPVRVLPSKTAIAPVNPTFLPKSEDEREMCARTVYCTNIDKKVTQAEIKMFFESFCGEVHRLRMLGDYHHSTRIAFVEFVMAESAISALNCSGAVLGTLPIRVSPSKTPVRPRPPRSPLH